MLSTADDIAYVMDDGLTSLSGHNLTQDSTHNSFRTDATDDFYNLTFIGTGLTLTFKDSEVTFGSTDHYNIIVDGVTIKTYNNGDTITPRTVMVQNLPYGTHVFRLKVMDTPGGEHFHSKEFTFHQPKKPPIPEDACVLADYMLMADFVKRTPAINDPSRISKGVRLVSASRDIFYDSAGTIAPASMKPISEAWVANTYTGFAAMFNGANNQNSHAQLPYFGTTEGDFTTRTSGDGAKITVSLTNSSGSLETSNVTLTSNTTISSQPTIPEGGSDSASHHTFVKSDGVLGSNTVKFLADGANSSTNYDWLYFAGMTVATPIHTSHHYQTFETPFLHELIGGDRNMEQTNLVCSPDGKTWDEVTRDTSYITVHTGMHCGGTPSGSAPVVAGSEHLFKHYEVYRGSTTGVEGLQKNFALAFDRIICLEDGYYICSWGARAHSGLEFQCYLRKNSTSSSFFTAIDSNNHGGDRTGTFRTVSFRLKRGDYLVVETGNGLTSDTSGHYTSFHIKKA